MKPRIALISLYSWRAFGVRNLYSILRSNDVEAYCIFYENFSLRMKEPSGKDMGKIVKLLKDLQVDIVGISVPSTLFKTAVRITDRIKKNLNLPTIWGGMHPTIRPEECIKFADYIFRGEAEKTLLEFINSWDSPNITNIPGVWGKNKDKIIKGSAPELIEDLDILPMPDLEEKNKYYIINGILSYGDPIYNLEKFKKYEDSCYHTLNFRGCPFNCSYCSGHVLKDIYKKGANFIRKRSVNNLIAELKTIKERFNPKTIVFEDECFASDAEWLKDFCKHYKEEICVPFYCEMHPNMINDENVRLLADAGMCDTCIGIQAGSEKIRAEYFNRDVTNKTIFEKIGVLRKHNIDIHYEIITDNPFETDNDKYETLRLLLQLPRPLHINLFSLNFFPDTEITKLALNKGIITDKDVEGESNRGMKQFILTSPKSKKDTFWNCLYFLVSDYFCAVGNIKGVRKFFSDKLILSFGKSKILRKFPFVFLLFIGLFELLILLGRKLYGVIRKCVILFPKKPLLFINIFAYSTLALIVVNFIGPKKLLKLLKSGVKKTTDQGKISKIINYTRFILHLWPWRNLTNYCYVRSTILYYFLKKEGVGVKINFGIKNEKNSLKGHSWLTVNNEPYLEDGDIYKNFTVIHSA